MIRKNRIKLAAWLVAWLLPLQAHALSQQDLESQLKDYKQPAKPISIVMIDQGKKLESLDGLKMGSEVQIGDLSQFFTVLLLVKEIDQGRMQLEDPVGRYLPHSLKRFNNLQLLDLATLNRELDADASMSLLAKVLAKRNKDHYWNLLQRKVLKPLKLHSAKVQTGLNPAVDGMKMSLKDMQSVLSLMIGMGGISDDWLYPVRMTQVDYWQYGVEQRALIWRSLPATSQIVEAGHGEYNQEMFTRIDEDPALFDQTRLFEKSAKSQQYQFYVAVRPNAQSGVLIIADKRYKRNQIEQLGRQILIN